MQKTIPRVVLRSPPREKWSVQVFPNGHGLPKVSGIPITIATDAHLPIISKGKPEAEGRAEMQMGKAWVAYDVLLRYIRENRHHKLGKEHVAALAALTGLVRKYAVRKSIDAPRRTTLDAALMQIKGVINGHGDAKVAVYSIDLSEKQHDYMLSKGLLIIARVLTFYLKPDEGKVRAVLTRSTDGSETQLSVKGEKVLSLPDEISYAVAAGLGIAGAELVSNGTYYLLRIPHGESSA